MKTLTAIIMIFLLLSGYSLAAEDAAGHEDQSEFVDISETATEIQGIWSVGLEGASQVVAALHQEGGLLFGSAKSEDDVWNAAFTGSVSGKNVDLTMIYLKGGSLFTLRLLGIVENESIMGSFVQVDDKGGANCGLFNAALINPDLSAYFPVEIEPEDAYNADSAIQQTVVPTTDTRVSESKYKDVRSLAGTIPETLGVGALGPVGFGGMGGGGGSGMS